MPTITLLSSGPVDAPSPLPVDLEDAIAATQGYAQEALTSKNAAATAATAAQTARTAADADSAATAEDRTAVHADRVAADAAAASTASDRTAVHTDRLAADADAAATAEDRTAVHADRVAAETARDNALATERRMRQQSLGQFANDAAAEAWAAAQSPAITIITGSSYLNTTSDIFRYAVVSAGPTIVWHDVTEDEAAQAVLAQASATAAAASAAAALTSKNTAATAKTDAETARDAAIGARDTAVAARDTTTAARDVTLAARDVATGARDTALSYSNAATAAYNNANALLSSVSASAIIAQQAAASVRTTPDAALLAAAQRAVALMTDAAVSFIYDTRKDSDGGAWVDKCVSQSWVTETLNTATRGVSAKFPKLALIVARNSTSGNPAITIYDLTDPTCPMWMVATATVAGIFGPGASYSYNAITALNGAIYVAQTTTGIIISDFIADTIVQRYTSTWYTAIGGVVGRSTNSTIATTGNPALASNNCNSIAATVAPNTPLNPLRFGLPNPTVAVGTAGVTNIIRWDGVVTSSDTGAGVQSICFDDKGNLWKAHFSAVYMIPPAIYQSASWSYLGVLTLGTSQIGVGTSPKVTACGQGMVAIAGPTGLATIKLDPTNPANSLLRVKTTTYDTGWMVLGKTVLAMAESSADLSTMVAAQIVLNGTGLSATTNWATAGFYTSTLSVDTGSLRVTASSGTGQGIAKQVLTTIPGRTYFVKAPFIRQTASSVALRLAFDGGDVGSYVMLTNSAAASGTLTGSFVATGTATTLFLNEEGASGTYADFQATCILVAADRSGSANFPAVVGSPTRGQVASGADCAGYSNLGGANYLEVAANSALDFGTGDWGFAFDIITGASGGFSFLPIASYGNGTGAGGGSAGWGVYVGSNGSIVLDLASGYLVFPNGSIPVSASAVASVEIAMRSGYAELFVNKVFIQRISTSAASATCVGATLRFGNWSNNSGFHSAATIGTSAPAWVGNYKLFNYARGRDQIVFAQSDAAGGFAAYSKQLLSGANVQAVAFDPDTGQLAASNSTGGTDVFAGPGFSVRVANWKSTTGANKIAGSAIIDQIGAGTNATLAKASISGPSKWGDATAFSITENNVTGDHSARICAGSVALAAGQTYLAVPVLVGSRSWAAIGSTGGAGPLGYFNAGTGANGSTLAGGASFVAPIAMGGGWYLFQIGFTASAGAYGPLVYTATGDNVASIVGDNGASGAALYIGKPFIKQGASPITLAEYSDGLSANDNHKAVAFAGGDLVVATGAGVDAFLGVKPGLRETAGGVGAPRRAFYDPTWGQFYGLTTDATPTVFASIPIPEGKAYRFRASVVAVMYGGTATEKAVYDITGVVSRDIGGNVVVVSTTTTVSEVTSTMDCVAQANTTAQTLEIKATGKASTRIAWFDGQELYDVGLMAAA